MNKVSAYWQDSLNLLLGFVMFAAPWIFGFAGEQTAAWNAHIVGAVIALMALLALYAFQSWEEWISGALGVWLVIAPWVLKFSAQSSAMLSHVIIGVATVVLAVWAANAHGSGQLPA